MDCVFCRIVSGDLPSRKVVEDGQVVAFHDLNPQAPVHVLVIPRRHLPSLAAASDDDGPVLGAMLLCARRVAEQLGLVEGGYRVVLNNGRAAGQMIDHIHLHVLGGRPLDWPPG
ncbi:MAG: histidine triad nucleotide-binding protein [Acetobacteraceae bacterium]|nr:histidine triad nucleotide-binding protein [Acetobacteraceae bacterium]